MDSQTETDTSTTTDQTVDTPKKEEVKPVTQQEIAEVLHKYHETLKSCFFPSSFQNKKVVINRAEMFLYGKMSLSMSVKTTREIERAAVCFYPRDSTIALLFNPDFVKDISNKALAGLIVHECRHLCHRHLSGGYKGEEAKFGHSLVNSAMDAAINQNMPYGEDLFNSMMLTDEKTGEEYPGGITLDTLERWYGSRPEANRESTYYMEWVKENQENEEQTQQYEEGHSQDDHQEIAEGDEEFEPLMKHKLRDMLYRAHKEAAKMFGSEAGNSEYLQKIEDSLKTKTPWRTLLRRYVGNRETHTYTANPATLSRPMMPSIEELGILYSDVRRETTVSALVAIDTSGSMCESAVKDCLAECLNLAKQGYTFDVVFADTEVTKPQTLDENLVNKPINVTGGGGTSFSPVFEFAAKKEAEGEPYDVIIYMTDGYAEDELARVSAATIWLVTEDGQDPRPHMTGGSKNQDLIWFNDEK